MKNVAIIMAGGRSTRYCRRTNTTTPKQFTLFKNGKTLIEETILRISNCIQNEDIYVVVNKKDVNYVSKYITNIPKENIIFEPLSKNTAPCIGYAAMVIKKKYNDANIIVLPSDHVINDVASFDKDIRLAINNINDNNILLLGVTPKRVETGYGYVQIPSDSQLPITKIINFDEKPSYNKAKQYIASNNYLWNTGIYITRNSTIINNISIYLNDLYQILERIYISIDNNQEEIVKKEYKNIVSSSIDFGIMEKTSNLSIIKASFDWKDIGTIEE